MAVISINNCLFLRQKIFKKLSTLKPKADFRFAGFQKANSGSDLSLYLFFFWTQRTADTHIYSVPF